MIEFSDDAPKTFDKEGFEALDYIELGVRGANKKPVIVIGAHQGTSDLSQDYPFETRAEYPIALTCQNEQALQALKQLGLSAVDVTSAIKGFNEAIRYSPPYKITIPEGLCIGEISDHSKGRDHGWYQKFNKPHGKRNLRR